MSYAFLLLAIILIILYYVFRGEMFADYYSFVKLYSGYKTSPFATYYSCDGKHLSYTFRKPLHRVDLKFITPKANIAIYGYNSSGHCGDSPIYIYYATDNGPKKKINSLWKLLVNEKGLCQKSIKLYNNYNCYHIELSF